MPTVTYPSAFKFNIGDVVVCPQATGLGEMTVLQRYTDASGDQMYLCERVALKFHAGWLAEHELAHAPGHRIGVLPFSVLPVPAVTSAPCATKWRTEYKPAPTPKVGPTCTLCGSPAYLGLISCECSNKQCRFYVPGA